MGSNAGDVAKNLAAIQKALDGHAKACDGTVIEIQMNPHELERLDFKDFRGIPIKPEPKLGTGTFRLICDKDFPPVEPEEIPEVVSTPTPEAVPA